jgi:hypothetical protein
MGKNDAIKYRYECHWSQHEGWHFYFGNKHLWEIRAGFMTAELVNNDGVESYQNHKKFMELEDALNHMRTRQPETEQPETELVVKDRVTLANRTTIVCGTIEGVGFTGTGKRQVFVQWDDVIEEGSNTTANWYEEGELVKVD